MYSRKWLFLTYIDNDPYILANSDNIIELGPGGGIKEALKLFKVTLINLFKITNTFLKLRVINKLIVLKN